MNLTFLFERTGKNEMNLRSIVHNLENNFEKKFTRDIEGSIFGNVECLMEFQKNIFGQNGKVFSFRAYAQL